MNKFIIKDLAKKGLTLMIVTHEMKFVKEDPNIKLSLEEREIVYLYAIAGFKHREIANLLQLPLATVLSKYHRSIKKLKIKYEEGVK